MGESKSNIVGILAIILSAAGLGLGGYVFISDLIVGEIQGPPGQDGQDGVDGVDGIDGMDAPGYYCASALELQQTLDSIGDASGVITITNDIALYGQINISGGGTYVIQGQSPAITIHSEGDWMSFNISNALYCRIQNLILNITDVITNSKAIINIEENNNNPVYIENIQISRDSGTAGRGINILSDDVRVKNCYMNQIYNAIYQPTGGGNYAEISDNVISGCVSYAVSVNGDYNNIHSNKFEACSDFAIYLGSSSDFNTITDNLLNNTDRGIELSFSSNNTIIRNEIYSLSGFPAIYIFGAGSQDNIVSENHISGTPQAGISLNGYYNIVTSNHISYAQYGIYAGITGGDNVLTENSIQNCDSGIYVTRPYTSITGNYVKDVFYGGITVISNGDNSVISGNIVRNLAANYSGNRYGIYINTQYCTISGNGVYSCYNDDASNDAYGFGIGADGDNCIIYGNVAYDNDFSFYLDAGALNVIGGATTNQFP
ncbi:MAG: right-handed parallel beta-helix repeat-containing protein [Promethearchaeota archaeon]